jgi:hypothetical protein
MKSVTLKTLILAWALTLPLVSVGQEASSMGLPLAVPCRPGAADAIPDEALLRFVVLADRTGGMRPGIHEVAVARANQLHPDFVISVGDLIDGYTEDEGLLDRQWAEFDAVLQGLELPYYFVPGNHDISNATMEVYWNRRLGSPYYHFLKKGVLFLVLHTEDGGRSGIGDEQVEYFLKVLRAHADAPWTFVIMHRPLWSYGDGDQSGFPAIEAALQGRPYTLFSGHHHHYQYAVTPEGMRRMVLATSGGGSDLRGELMGEFDHLTYVVFAGGQPKISHLRLDAFVPEDVVDAQTIPLVKTLREGAFFSVEPMVVAHRLASKLQTFLKLHNPGERPLRMHAVLPPAPEGWNWEPSTFEQVLLPGATFRLPLSLERVDASAGGVDELPPFRLNVAAVYDGPKGPIEATASQDWVIDWKRPLEAFAEDPVVLPETLTFHRITPPAFCLEGWDYRGEGDLSAGFRVAEGPKQLHFRLEWQDDRVVLDASKGQDAWSLSLRVLPDGEAVSLVLPAFGDGSHAKPLPIGWKGKRTGTEGGLSCFDFSVDKQLIGLGANATGIEVNWSVTDLDDASNAKPSVLFWKLPEGNLGMGQFLREQAE